MSRARRGNSPLPFTTGGGSFFLGGSSTFFGGSSTFLGGSPSRTGVLPSLSVFLSVGVDTLSVVPLSVVDLSVRPLSVVALSVGPLTISLSFRSLLSVVSLSLSRAATFSLLSGFPWKRLLISGQARTPRTPATMITPTQRKIAGPQ